MEKGTGKRKVLQLLKEDWNKDANPHSFERLDYFPEVQVGVQMSLF